MILLTDVAMSSKKTVLQSNVFLLAIEPLKAENEKEGDKMADIKYKPITTDIAAGASITVTALGTNVDQVLIYPVEESTAVIANSVVNELGGQSPTLKIEQIEEKIEVVKKSLDEIEIDVKLFKLRIKFSPKTIIKNYVKKSLA